MIINFENDCTLLEKITEIKKYIILKGGKSIYSKTFNFILIPSIYAILLYCFYQLGKTIFQLIISFYDEILEPLVISIFKKNIWAKRSELQEMELNFDNLYKTYETLRFDYRNLSSSASENENEKHKLTKELKIKNEELSDYLRLEKTLQLYKEDEEKSTNYLISELFRGEFICRYDGISNNIGGKETFIIDENKFIINNKTYAIIKNVKYYENKKFLYFEKHFIDNRPIGKNYLIEIATNHYLGREDTSESFKIEYHSSSIKKVALTATGVLA
jgi:hypothetical protein